MSTNRILFVDDDENILFSMQRQLRKHFSIEVAKTAEEGLQQLSTANTFGVVVSDMRMPGMDGVQFLGRARQVAPDIVRVMLTGDADKETAIQAVNRGEIFRFLNKPCPQDQLVATLTACVEQHRLINAERELLANTLSGSVSLLTEILSLANPLAFGRASRIKRLALELGEQMHLPRLWELKLAAMFSQIGCITLPDSSMHKLCHGIPLSAAEDQLFQSHPEAGQRMIERIPRLDVVARVIGQQFCDYDPDLTSQDEAEERNRLYSSILRAVSDFDFYICGGATVERALDRLGRFKQRYHPQVLQSFADMYSAAPTEQAVNVMQLKEGMVVNENVFSESGNLLLGRGQELTTVLCERLRAFASSAVGVRQPIQILTSSKN
ncbi:response regulator [bacterium]|nr:response regulator [bacterium]